MQGIHSTTGSPVAVNCFVLRERQLNCAFRNSPFTPVSEMAAILAGTSEISTIPATDGPRSECVIATYSRTVDSIDTFCDAISVMERVLVISGGLNCEELGRIRRVAAGIVAESASAAVLVDAIRAVMKGETWKEMVLLDGSAALRADPSRPGLTYRQRRVLQYLYEGYSNKQIAGALGVSHPSVKATVQQLFQKLQVRTRAQLVRTAIEGSELRSGANGLETGRGKENRLPTFHTPHESISGEKRMSRDFISCPICRSLACEESRRMLRVPVNVSALYPTAQEALRAPAGTIRLASCKSCGLVFNCAFDPTAITYDVNYDNSLQNSRVFQDYSDQLASRLVREYGLRRKRIVEIGCGQGDFLRLLCSRGENEGHGFDPTYVGPPQPAEGVSIHRSLYSENSDLPGVSCVVCRHVLEHIPTPAQFVRQLRSALNSSPGATVYCEVPNADAIFDRTGSGLWDVIYPHFTCFSMRPLAHLFESANFDVINSGTSYDGQFLFIEARPAAPRPSNLMPKYAGGENDLSQFAGTFDRTLALWTDYLRRTAEFGTKVALWGAGAKGTSFLNLVPGANRIATVVDANPRKHSMYVPGTGQRIDDVRVLGDVAPELVITLNPIYREEIAAQLRSLHIDARLVSAPPAELSAIGA